MTGGTESGKRQPTAEGDQSELCARSDNRESRHRSTVPSPPFPVSPWDDSVRSFCSAVVEFAAVGAELTTESRRGNSGLGAQRESTRALDGQMGRQCEDRPMMRQRSMSRPMKITHHLFCFWISGSVASEASCSRAPLVDTWKHLVP